MSFLFCMSQVGDRKKKNNLTEGKNRSVKLHRIDYIKLEHEHSKASIRQFAFPFVLVRSFMHKTVE